MSGYGWQYRPQDIEKIAEFLYNRAMRGPLLERWFQMNAQLAAQAAEARLAAGIAKLRASSVLIGAGSLVLTLAVPIAVWIGVFAAMGAPYAEARALVMNANFQTGFSQGFVMGLLKWEWQQLVSRFFKFGPDQINVMDRSLSFVAANAVNEGLRSGFLHARIFDDATNKVLLDRLKSLSPSTRPGRWTRLDQRDYVVELAAAGRGKNFFRTA